MIRGTTPVHVFEFTDIEDIDNLKEITITYKQNDEVVLYKTKSAGEIILEENNAVVRLSQKEAFSFEEHTPVEIQVKVLTDNDLVFASRIFIISILKVLDENIL